MPQYVEVNGQNIEFPDGMAFGDIEAALKKNAMSLPAAVSAGKAINANVNSIPRQLGLTARYGLEGLANTAQIVTEPLRYLTDRATGLTGKTTPLGVQATKLADLIGLPSPEDANERVIGDATRLVAGAGGMAAGARAASALPGVVGNVMTGLAANPSAQLASAGGAGLAGGASREAGGSPWTQAGASLLGGVAGGFVPGIAGSVANLTKRTVTPAMTPAELDVKLSTVLERAGTDYSQLPGNVKASLRKELADSLQAGKDLNADAVSRLAAFKAVGATPTRGMISQNPVDITREQNLAKIAANSADTQLHGLPLLQNQNNQTLIRNLNEVGAGAGTLPVEGGRAVTGAVQGRAAALRSAEDQAWNAAKSAPGYATQPIYPDALNAINRELGAQGLMPFMNPTISRYMEAFQNGQQPFTAQAYRNLQSMLAREASKGGNEGFAAGQAQRILAGAEVSPITNPRGIDFGTAPVTGQMAAAMRAQDAAAPNAVDLVNRARSATRAAYGYAESSPLVRSALSDARTADPARIAQSYIIGGTADEAREVARQVGPQGLETIKQVLANHIKEKALSGASDETGKVSQAALNRAINSVGEEKLRLFFTPDEVRQLHNVGRVASLIQVQPVGSAVNNSNSGALLLGRGLDLLDKVPVVGPMVSPSIRNIDVSIKQKQAQNVIPGLLAPQPKDPLAQSLMLPGLAVGGGLLSLP